MKEYNIFAERLKNILSNKMTQRELAEKTGLTEVTISRYVNGQRVPKGTEIVKISQAINVSCDYLLGVVDNEKDYKMSNEEKLCAIKEVIKEYDGVHYKDAVDYLKMIKSILS